MSLGRGGGGRYSGISYTLAPCYSECDPKTNSISIAWEVVRNSESQATPRTHRVSFLGIVLCLRITPQTGQLKQQKWSHSFRGYKFEIKVLAELVSSVIFEVESMACFSPSLWCFAGNLWNSLACICITLISALMFTWHSPCVQVSLHVALFKDTSHTDTGA